MQHDSSTPPFRSLYAINERRYPRRGDGAGGPPRRTARLVSRRRRVRWGRVAPVLVVLCAVPLLAGMHNARQTTPDWPVTETEAQTLLANTAMGATLALPAPAATHVTLYCGTASLDPTQAAAERLRAAGYVVTVAEDLAGLTDHSFLFQVDHPDAAAAVGIALGLAVPIQPAVSEYAPLDVCTSSTDPACATGPAEAEVIVILGGDYTG